jgi:single-strand DNA-binding protein
MINEAILVGHVGKKDTKTLKNGIEMTMISIATTEKYMDSSGEKQSKTTWHNVNCFSKLAAVAEKYVHVGDLVYIRGKIQNKKIEEGERAGQYIYSVTANDIKFIPTSKKSELKSEPENKKITQPAQYRDNYNEFEDLIPF